MWDRWPYQRIGARLHAQHLRSPRGMRCGCQSFLYQLANDYNVSLDVEGPGVFYFARYNHWHGSPWHYEVDGTDHIVRETSTADPLHPAAGSVLLPATLFPNPLTWTWSQTKGADLSWVPLSFEKSFRMAYTRTRYGTGYYIYDHYIGGAKLSRQFRLQIGRLRRTKVSSIWVIDPARTSLRNREQAEFARSPDNWNCRHPVRFQFGPSGNRALCCG